MLSDYSNARFNRFNINDFEIMKVIGSGNFGNVYLAKGKADGLLVAIKRYKKRKIFLKKMEQDIFYEVYNHSLVNHPHITKLIAYFHDSEMVYFVLEYAENGSLYDLMKKQCNKRFNEGLAAKYTHELADGLRYCHLHKFLHGDLKPENVVIDAQNNAKITDFGLSLPLDRDAIQVRGCHCGTLEYMAPELLKEETTYDEKIDYWSLGVMCYEFLVGRTAFYHKRRCLMIQRILDVDLIFPEIVGDEAQNLIKNLLHLQPKDRLPLEDVMTHTWVKSNLEKARRA